MLTSYNYYPEDRLSLFTPFLCFNTGFSNFIKTNNFFIKKGIFNVQKYVCFSFEYKDNSLAPLIILTLCYLF